jgi:hypothetical protein
MKVLIIDFRLFNGIGFQYATQYYVDGRRVSRNRYYQMSTYIYDNFKHESTRLWSNTNKNGIYRAYTEIIYKSKQSRSESY